MKAKILNAIFDTCEYPVHEFSNGLILVPSESSIEWFFEDTENIQGCGFDKFLKTEDSEETVDYTALELAQIWGNSCGEHGVDESILPLIKELVRNKGE